MAGPQLGAHFQVALPDNVKLSAAQRNAIAAAIGGAAAAAIERELKLPAGNTVMIRPREWLGRWVLVNAKSLDEIRNLNINPASLVR